MEPAVPLLNTDDIRVVLLLEGLQLMGTGPDSVGVKGDYLHRELPIAEISADAVTFIRIRQGP